MNIFQKNKKIIKGFTLVELLVSVAIFAFMTTLMVARYGNFNQSVLLTNLAYDVAVTIRTAQSYGLSVKGSGNSNDADRFQKAYGVYFDSQSAGNDEMYYLFSDINDDSIFDGEESGEMIQKFTLKRGTKIYGVCTENIPCDPDAGGIMTIVFQRPDPNARICDDEFCNYAHGAILIKSPDGSERLIRISENGQISVGE
jgi:prepilin-type N-terminal cleavage/methylation domain-containing protein